jgi:hypothetical protein
LWSSFRRRRSVSFSLFAIIAISMTIANICYLKYNGKAYAHILSSNENAALLAIFYQIQTEAELAQRTYASNITLAHEHTENALGLLKEDWTNSTTDRATVVNDIAPVLYTLDYLIKQDGSDSDIKKIVNHLHSAMEEFVYVYVGESILANPAIQARALVDIINVVDSRYSSAFETDSDKMPSAVGMSHMMTNMITNSNTLNMKTNNSEKLSLAQSNNNTHNPVSLSSLTNIADYQTAQALTTEAQTIFNNQLATKVFPNAMSATTILQLEEDLGMLKTLINNKKSYEDVMTIIHGRIHPLLIRTYNLM